MLLLLLQAIHVLVELIEISILYVLPHTKLIILMRVTSMVVFSDDVPILLQIVHFLPTNRTLILILELLLVLNHCLIIGLLIKWLAIRILFLLNLLLILLRGHKRFEKVLAFRGWSFEYLLLLRGWRFLLFLFVLIILNYCTRLNFPGNYFGCCFFWFHLNFFLWYFLVFNHRMNYNFSFVYALLYLWTLDFLIALSNFRYGVSITVMLTKGIWRCFAVLVDNDLWTFLAQCDDRVLVKWLPWGFLMNLRIQGSCLFIILLLQFVVQVIQLLLLA